jgi:MerR family transcriptional regulator, heat shock protein HspR
MADKTHALILWRTEHSLLTLDDLADAVGLHPELVKEFVDYGLIEPAVSTGSLPLFSASAVERLRCIIRVRRDLGVNLAGAGVIVEMRERILNLQRELERLRRRFNIGE